MIAIMEMMIIKLFGTTHSETSQVLSQDSKWGLSDWINKRKSRQPKDEDKEEKTGLRKAGRRGGRIGRIG